MPVGAIGAGFNDTPQISNAKEAAGALEAMLFKELMKSMTESVGKAGLFGEGFQANMYQDMYASVLAEQGGGHLGISSMLEQALGVSERAKATSTMSNIGSVASALGSYRAVAEKSDVPPANVGLYKTAMSFLDNVSSARWGKEGILTTADLAADIATNSGNGIAAFNVQDANGYEGFPKCNLFAFEMLRRAGYTVPVTGRSHGWGYMGADTTTNLAAKGDVNDWATVRTDNTRDQLDGLAYSGVPLLLTSSGAGDRVGHMAVADRIHTVKRDDSGNIVALEYSGWEATTKGASYGRRMWRVEGVPGNGRGGLSSIEILEPKRSDSAAPYIAVGNRHPGASVTDKPESSQGSDVTTDIR
ncbi:MAG: rod-binding protein [Deltaproteobacteria bacterium]|nr:rod-binding protein [Deltaproteobacteria bacterium]MBN2674734.1 rod-binding protein [Deltaproteobacteria bacterium]